MKPEAENPESEILNALRALAESDRDKEAPPEVEARLLQAYRRRRPGRSWNRAAMWTLAAAAAVVAMMTVYEWRPRPQPVRTAGPVPASTVEPQPVAFPPVAGQAVVSKPARRPAPVRQPSRREIVTEFFPLDDVAPPFERGELVRVNLPASAMRTVGLPVREDRLLERVQADVLVSEEGLARAIRFVKYSQ
jgi:hypothetical protein